MPDARPARVPDARPIDAAERARLVTARLAHVRGLLAATGAGVALLYRRRDVAWVTVGSELHVVQGGDEVAAPLLVTPDAAVVLAPNNEAARIADEEVAGLPLELDVVPWFETEDAVRLAADHLARGHGVLRDGELERVLGPQRARLAPPEHARMRWLASEAVAALDGAAGSFAPGRTESEVVATLVAPLVAAAVRVPVALAGADERMRYRHPLPTRKPLQDRLMLVLVAERWGLHVAGTRMAWLGGDGGTHPADAQAARVLNAMTAATRPGATLGGVLEAAALAYEAEGLAGEWEQHHQGGTIGYGPRERIATPADLTVIETGMAVAWNPSVPGGKAEATLLVTDTGAEVILT